MHILFCLFVSQPMTRINANVPPAKLHRLHLIAEFREITMVPASLRRSLRSKTHEAILESIPKQFTLNKGHVTFFYDKQVFLQRRFHALVDEMEKRGYKADRSRAIAFEGFPIYYNNDWLANEVDNVLIHERIALRISEKPHLYKDWNLL
ncbi:endonuclease V [archaeon]|nr:MAG: endonuclease V [archaeon]